MFTGIIEHLGTVEALSLDTNGGHVTIQASTLAASLAVSASVAVNGCCLTVVACDKKTFSADLSVETLNKTTFSALKVGDRVNLEQPLTTRQRIVVGGSSTWNVSTASAARRRAATGALDAR